MLFRNAYEGKAMIFFRVLVWAVGRGVDGMGEDYSTDKYKFLSRCQCLCCL